MEKIEKKMRLTLSAIQYCLGEYSLFENSTDTCPLTKDKNPQMMKSTVSCSFSVSEGIVTISYTERINESQATQKRTVTYNLDKNVAVIENNGESKSSFEIKQGKVSTSQYQTPLGVFTLGVMGLSLSAKMSERGVEIFLDYVSELCGCEAQRIKMRISVKEEMPCE